MPQALHPLTLTLTLINKPTISIKRHLTLTSTLTLYPPICRGGIGHALVCHLTPTSTLTLTRTQSPLPRPEPALTVTVTYDHCSGIGNGVISHEIIPPPYP